MDGQNSHARGEGVAVQVLAASETLAPASVSLQHVGGHLGTGTRTLPPK